MTGRKTDAKPRHRWTYHEDLSALAIGKRLQGFMVCVHGCGWARFSGAGMPPWHRYVRRDDILPVDDGRVTKDSALPLAPTCELVERDERQGTEHDPWMVDP